MPHQASGTNRYPWPQIGLDPLGRLGFVTELAAQARDTDVEHAVHAVVFAFEEVFEEGLARLDFPGV